MKLLQMKGEVSPPRIYWMGQNSDLLHLLYRIGAWARKECNYVEAEVEVHKYGCVHYLRAKVRYFHAAKGEVV